MIEDPPRYRELSDQVPGSAVAEPWFTWFLLLAKQFNDGYTGTVALAKLTGGGTDGQLRFVHGVLVEVTQPT